MFTVLVSQAQQPLSKRDQKKKAEFEAMIEAEEKYELLRAKADRAFRKKDYAEARMAYAEAIQYNKEEEQWLISKVNDLDILMAEIVAREVDSITVTPKKQVPTVKSSEIATPTELKQREEIEFEASAQDLDPEPEELAVVEPELIEQPEPVVEEIEGKPDSVIEMVVAEKPIVEPAPKSKPAEKTPKPTVSENESVSENQSAKTEEAKKAEDYSRFPQGRTDETFTFPDHTVRRIVVKDKRDVIVYKYVTHRWGGKFYFKDGVSIVERIWKQELQQYEAKFPENLAE